MTDITTIVVNLNTRDLLRACLASIYAEGSGLQIEWIVIDNGSTDGSPEMAKREYPKALVVANRSNRDLSYVHELYENVMLSYYMRYRSPGVILDRLILACGFLIRSVGWTAR